MTTIRLNNFFNSVLFSIVIAVSKAQVRDNIFKRRKIGKRVNRKI